MLSKDEEKAIVLLAFAQGGGSDDMAPGCVATSLIRVGRNSENVSHADFIRLQGKVERLNQVLNGSGSYSSLYAGPETGAQCAAPRDYTK